LVGTFGCLFESRTDLIRDSLVYATKTKLEKNESNTDINQSARNLGAVYIESLLNGGVSKEVW